VTPSPADPILTLEPLVDAVRDGVEASGWQLSGLQKTTSHQFEGKWAGDSTRSAYLFFHRADGPDWASVDVYLDETSRGLSGNLALVVDGCALAELGDVDGALHMLGGITRAYLPEAYRTPITLRLRLADPLADPGTADSEVRFKLRIPRAALDAGPGAVTDLARDTAGRFTRMLEAAELRSLLDP
jgi:hypothetical protein